MDKNGLGYHLFVSNLKSNNGMDLLSLNNHDQSRLKSMKELKNSSVCGQVLSGCDKGSSDNGSNYVTSTSQAALFQSPLNGFPFGAYAQSPLLVPCVQPQLYIQNRLRQPLSHTNPAIMSAVHPTIHDLYDLRCAVCGLACTTMFELHEHIIKKHITSDAIHTRKLSTSESDQQERRDSLSSQSYKEDSSVHSTPLRKDSAESSSNSIESDKNSPSDFPIPTPNFALLTSHSKVPTLPSLLVNNPTRMSDPSKMYSDGLLAPFSVNPQLKSLPFPSLPGAYGMFNSYLAYQNLVNMNGIFPSSSVSQTPSASSGMNMSANTGFPFVRYPIPGGGFPPRFSCLPGMPVMMASSSGADSIPASLDTHSHKEQQRDSIPPKTNPVAGRLMSDIEQSASNIDHLNFSSSRQAESLRRRLSVPLIGLNKEFRVPHAYGRIGKSNNASAIHCPTLLEQNEPNSERLKKSYLGTHRQEIDKKRTSVNDKPLSNRLNAKSIEQHISKLISNNEKVLLNPVLERVKPRRVFRRNSLDPASLSSYAAGLRGNNLDSSYFKDDDVIKKTRKLLGESAGGFGGSLPTSTAANLNFPPGMTFSEYDRMIQLTRVPPVHNHQKLSSVADEMNEQVSGLTKMFNESQNPNKTSLLGKREISVGTGNFNTKKPRQAPPFTCSDCGVGYRKQENYRIHKLMYCKYKKDNSKNASLLHSSSYPPTSQFNTTEELHPVRRHSDLPQISTSRLNSKISDSGLLHDGNPTSSSKSTSLSPNPIGTVNHTNIQHSKVIPAVLQTQIPSSPTKFFHNDLCRTKSADDALKIPSVLPSEKDVSQASKLAVSTVATKTNYVDLSNENSLSSVIESNTKPSNTQSTPGCTVFSIPTNKLPPNKRHLIRHFEQGSNSESAVHNLESDVMASTVTSNKEIVTGLISSVSATPSDVTHSSDVTVKDIRRHSCDVSGTFNLDEAAVPRSNYKLLLHQISLRNLQDMGFLDNRSSRFSEDKSVWSWQQIQNGLQSHNSSEGVLKSPTNLSSAEISRLNRKFSVPSRLPKISELQSSAVPVTSTCASTSQVSGSTSAVNDSSPISSMKHNHQHGSASLHSAHKSLPSCTLPLHSLPNTAAEPMLVDVLVEKEMKDQVILNQNSTSSTLHQSFTFNPTNGMKCTQSVSSDIKTSSNTKDKQDNAIATEKGFQRIPEDNRPNDNEMVWMSGILYPHLRPELTGKSHVSYCCMVSPQPTCMEIPKSGQSESTQLSMYSDWVVSEPILIPNDLSITNILTGWRRSRPGYNKGLVMVVKSNPDLIVTNSKSYEEQKSKRDDEKKVGDAKTTPKRNEDHVIVSESSQDFQDTNDVLIPTMVPSALVVRLVKPIYASCHNSTGSLAISSSDSSFRKNDFKGGSKFTDSQSSVTTSGTFSLERSTSFSAGQASAPVSSTIEDSGTGSVQTSKLHHSKFNPDGKITIVSDSSSGRLTELDSDPVDVKIEYAGKVKRRRTRRERSAISPREKRRARQCKSPQSPAAVLPVHQSNACSKATEEKLRGCALCSIKAGRTNLVTDATSACKPCRDAAKKSHRQSLAAKTNAFVKTTLPACSPSHVSPPCTSSGFLDKTRASSGNTQHWVSNSTPDLLDEPTHQPGVFRYPSPHSSRSSVSDILVDPAVSSSSQQPLQVASNKTYRNLSDVDASKTPVSSMMAQETSPSVVSPSLAEIVSEVMRTAAMQSKRHDKSTKRHHLLSNSRALVLGNPSVSSVYEQLETSKSKASSDTQIYTDNVNSSTANSTSKSSPQHSSTTFTHSKLPPRVDSCEITVTTATAPSSLTFKRNQQNAFQNIATTLPLIEVNSQPLENCGRRNVLFASNENDSSSNKLNTQDLTNTSRESAHLKEKLHNSATGMEAVKSPSLVQNIDNDLSYHEDLSCGSDEDGIKDDAETSRPSDGTARPHRCLECKVAFRIGGHLAKHLRSKGHALAMQKKTLNRLKLRQIQLCVGGGFNGPLSTTMETANPVSGVVNASLNGSSTSLVSTSKQADQNPPTSSRPEFLEGTEVLARSQVRALLEGSGEYACVPSTSCDEVITGDLSDDIAGSQDPRPFKCIACKVAFRFQGHLDRHFRSNLHLIAVGHYEQDASLGISKGLLSSEPNNDGNCVEKKENVEKGDPKSGIKFAEENKRNDASPLRTCSALEARFEADDAETNKKPSNDKPSKPSEANSVHPPMLLPFSMCGSLLTRNGYMYSQNCLANKRSPSDAIPGIHSPRTDEAVSAVRTGRLKSSSPLFRDTLSSYDSTSKLQHSYPSMDSNDHLTERRNTPQHHSQRDRPDDSITMRSTDCLKRKVVMPCQVSCT